MAAKLFWSKIFRVSTELNLLPMISVPLTESLVIHTIMRTLPPPHFPPSSKQKQAKIKIVHTNEEKCSQILLCTN